MLKLKHTIKSHDFSLMYSKT